MKRINDLVRLIALAVMAYAVYQELSKRPEQRTWHGLVADFVPYEFRVPTMERVRSRVWNPDDPRILVPTIFGVGWTLNAASLAREMKARCAACHE